jgi:hypothetical protein
MAFAITGNHTFVHTMKNQLKKDRRVPRTAEIPIIDIINSRYFLMSTVNVCMIFPPLICKIHTYYISLPFFGQEENLYPFRPQPILRAYIKLGGDWFMKKPDQTEMKSMPTGTDPQQVKKQIQKDVAAGQGSMTSREAGAMRD